MRIFLFVIGLLVFLEGLSYFAILPDTVFREWLLSRRQSWWMRMWPPVQWALDSEKVRLIIGSVQTILGALLMVLSF